MEQDGSPLSERQRYWLEHLSRCREQGLTLKSYAEQQGLKVSALYGWKQNLKRRGVLGTDAGVTFARVQVQAPESSSGRYRLHFPNGCMLEWEGAVNEAVLGAVVALLGSNR